MNWAERRRLLYALLLILLVGGIVFFGLQRAIVTNPSCTDGKKDGTETGVDCGGICNKYCPNELEAPKVRWVRVFQITPGFVHAVAYIEHSYPIAAARTLQYQFRLYDDKNNIITTRDGTTFIGPMGRSAIVETIIPVGKAVPALTRFIMNTPVAWEKIPSDFSRAVIKTNRTLLETYQINTAGQSGTRLTATLENQSRFDFKNLEVVAILYDENENAITASKALLKTLDGQGTQIVYFTWPFVMPTKISRIEVLPRFNPFTTAL